MLKPTELDLIHGKKALLAFSDPGGAKTVLSFANLNREMFKSVLAISNRVHGFYQDFDFNVETYKDKTPEEWLKASQAEVLVTGTSFPNNVEVSLIREAARQGIVSLSFIDHWINMAIRFQSEDSLVFPDWICVIDERARQIAIEEGLPAEKLLVTGNPSYKFIARWKPKVTRDEFLKKVGLPSEAIYILYAPDPLSLFWFGSKYGFFELDGLKLIYEAMRPIQDKKIYILVKGHSNQKHEIFMDYLSQQADSRLLYITEEDINTCIYYSECVFGLFSTCLIEAQIIGRLVIRPLVYMSDGVIDPLKEMESPTFLSFRDKSKFTAAVQAFANEFLLQRRDTAKK